MNVPRSIDEMITALRIQLALLAHHRITAGREGRTEYVPEIANKLRLLAVDIGRSNTALLLEVMRRTGITAFVPNDGPPVRQPNGEPMPDSWTLEEFMNLLAVAIRIQSGEMVEFTRSGIVRAVAEKMGGAHQDWEIPANLAAALETPIYLNNRQLIDASILSIAATVIRVGDSFLKLYAEATAAREAPQESAAGPDIGRPRD
jgi:hypothetical protein